MAQPQQPAAATGFRPEMEARFKGILDARPSLKSAQIKAKLSQNPPISPKVYSTWLAQYLKDHVMRKLSAGPVSRQTVENLLRSIRYDDPSSMSELVHVLNSPTGVARIPLGSYMTPDSKNIQCFLQPKLGDLPYDFPADPSRGDALVTQAKCEPAAPAIPEFFLEVGQLCTSSVATDPSENARQTEFVVVVAPNRHVFAFWNPLGIDPDVIVSLPSDSSDDSKSSPPRPTAGLLPGFQVACAAVYLGFTVEDLSQGSRELPIQNTNFLFAAPGGNISFGGVDSSGWSRLKDVSPAFASVRTYPVPKAPPAAAP